MIGSYILSERFFLKRKGLSDARFVLVPEKKYGFVLKFFEKIHKVSQVNIG